jgi:hypothetical protein
MRLLHPERDREQIAENRAAVLEKLPELVPFIKELHALGMIDGWRNVVDVGPPEPFPTDRRDVHPVDGEQMTDVIARLKKNGTLR